MLIISGWIYVLGCIAAFAVAAANGANDVANSFATSVGSKALKMWHAILIASICEFSGAALLGSRVATTIRNNIATPKAFVNHDDIFMFGMLCALISVASWVFFATYMEMAVSITHSIIGAIIGFALCSTAGAGSIDWNSIGTIVASWFASPAISAAISFIFFTTIRAVILRHENAFNRVLMLFPVIVAITFFINVMFIIFKGGIASITSGKGSGLASGSQITTAQGFGIAVGVGVGGGLLVGLLAIPFLRQRIGGLSEEEVERMAKERGNVVGKLDVVSKQVTEGEVKIIDGGAASVDDSSSAVSEKKYSLIDRLVHQKLIDDAAHANRTVVTLHETAEVFPIRAELAFGYLQIFTACFASFAHGSNDVANSIGPLSAIVAVFQGGPGTMANAVANKGNVNVPDWVLFIGCSGLVVGLTLYGHIIIAAMGMKYAKITPSRGFCAELSFSFVVVIGSFLGIPLSTTQCIVGAILGIGLAEGRKDAVNWWIFGKTLFGWIITLIVCGVMTALTFSFAVYAPSLIYPLSANNCLAFYGGSRPADANQPNFFSMPVNTTLGDQTSYVIDTQDGTLYGFFGYPSTGQVISFGSLNQ
jgi:sodium-dependent phosphate transporter